LTLHLAGLQDMGAAGNLIAILGAGGKQIMNLVPTDLQGVCCLHVNRYLDGRGYFLERYRQEWFAEAGIDAEFVQDNHSKSAKNTLRGLHFQHPRAQGKLIMVVQGAIFDVVVDIQKGSPSFGNWLALELNEDSDYMIWIPPGYAHGFLTLADETQVFYKATDYWVPEAEQIVRWDDPDLAIQWPTTKPILSERDASAPRLAELSKLPKYPSAHGNR
jgi:dTDP-4-dehydrorhamnose 3,5-epimerase